MLHPVEYSKLLVHFGLQWRYTEEFQLSLGMRNVNFYVVVN